MNKSFAEIDSENKGIYLKLLSAVSKISGLFSESAIPFINYRVVENIFCKSFDAVNLGRSDTAFDADYNSLGVGIKTFICPGQSSLEKIAEFNSLAEKLRQFENEELAYKLAEYRNRRISMACELYNIQSSIYHIVVRREKELCLFEADYDIINIDRIHSIKHTRSGLQFKDDKNFYSFNKSKSTLYRKFHIPDHPFILPVEIIEDPYNLILDLFENKDLKPAENLRIGIDYVILPLYSTRSSSYGQVQKASALNQWNAEGRKRDFGEIYIPIPSMIHRSFPEFFPSVDSSENNFKLITPVKDQFNASICQTYVMKIDGKKVNKGKGLMTNPNKKLSQWLLRDTLKLKEGELSTREKLDELGFDCVIIIKTDQKNYKIDIMKTGSYEEFQSFIIQ